MIWVSACISRIVTSGLHGCIDFDGAYDVFCIIVAVELDIYKTGLRYSTESL